MVILLGQIPLWIIQSVSIRNLLSLLPNPADITAQVAYTELTVGGFLWIPNLTQVDASFILPIALGIVNLSIIECQTRMRTRPPGKWQKITTNCFRGLSVLMVPVACTVPAVRRFRFYLSFSCNLYLVNHSRDWASTGSCPVFMVSVNVFSSCHPSSNDWWAFRRCPVKWTDRTIEYTLRSLNQRSLKTRFRSQG